MLSHVQLFATPWTVHGILQARILEWVAFPFFRGSPTSGIEPRSPTLQADSLPAEPQGKPKNPGVGSLSLLQGTEAWNRAECLREVWLGPMSSPVLEGPLENSLRATCGWVSLGIPHGIRTHKLSFQAVLATRGCLGVGEDLLGLPWTRMGPRN